MLSLRPGLIARALRVVLRRLGGQQEPCRPTTAPEPSSQPDAIVDGAPAETLAQVPAERPAETLAEVPAESPGETLAQEPVEPPAGSPAKIFTEALAEARVTTPAVAASLLVRSQTDFQLPARLASISSLNCRSGRQPRRPVRRDVNAKPVPVAKRGAMKGPRVVTGPLFVRAAPATASRPATVLSLPVRPAPAAPDASPMRQAA